MKLKEVLKETVMKNHLCPNATDAEIHVYSIAKHWFRFASDWEGGRKKRTEKKSFSPAQNETNREQEAGE